jgi:coproporphyrinogen III oxidase
MPPVAKWHYDFVPENGSEEARTIELLKKGKAWI